MLLSHETQYLTVCFNFCEHLKPNAIHFLSVWVEAEMSKIHTSKPAQMKPKLQAFL